jgi:hypothetical protein
MDRLRWRMALQWAKLELHPTRRGLASRARIYSSMIKMLLYEAAILGIPAICPQA